jgi:chromosome segregation ATPase
LQREQMARLEHLLHGVEADATHVRSQSEQLDRRARVLQEALGDLEAKIDALRVHLENHFATTGANQTADEVFKAGKQEASSLSVAQKLLSEILDARAQLEAVLSGIDTAGSAQLTSFVTRLTNSDAGIQQLRHQIEVRISQLQSARVSDARSHAELVRLQRQAEVLKQVHHQHMQRQQQLQQMLDHARARSHSGDSRARADIQLLRQHLSKATLQLKRVAAKQRMLQAKLTVAQARHEDEVAVQKALESKLHNHWSDLSASARAWIDALRQQLLRAREQSRKATVSGEKLVDELFLQRLRAQIRLHSLQGDTEQVKAERARLQKYLADTAAELVQRQEQLGNVTARAQALDAQADELDKQLHAHDLTVNSEHSQYVMGLQTDLQHAQREAHVARQLLQGGRVEVASVIDVSHDKAVVAAEAQLHALEATERRLTKIADQILTKAGIKTDQELALSNRELMEVAVEADLAVAEHHAKSVASRLLAARARVQHLTAALDATRKLEAQQQPSEWSTSELEHRLSQLHQSLARARVQERDFKQAAAKAQTDLAKRREAIDKLKAASSSMIETEMKKYVHEQQASIKALVAQKKVEVEKLRAEVKTVQQKNANLQVWSHLILFGFIFDASSW